MFPFVYFDDEIYVYQNPAVVHGLTLHDLAAAFSSHGIDNWIPLTMLSHVLDCQIYGLKAGGHHLTNLLLHAATAILLFLVLRRMTAALWRSAFVAAVFAIHPVVVESVAWVSERKDVLSGLFFMLTLWAYVGYVRQPASRIRYWAALAFAALGLMSKPMLVTLPLILLLVDYWPLRRFPAQTFQRLFVEKIPFLLLSAAACVVTFVAQKQFGAVSTLTKFPLPLRLENTFISYARYLGKLFWPKDLAVFYPWPEHWPLLPVFLSAVLLLGLSIAALALAKRFPFVPTGWFWFVGMLVPVIGLVQVGFQAMADRYLYLPQIGLYLLVTWLVADLCVRLRHRFFILGSLCAVILAALTYCARIQTGYWAGDQALWTHSLACTPDNEWAHYNFGNALVEEEQFDAAITQLQQALTMDPNDGQAHNSLGNALLHQGQLDAAIAQYQAAIKTEPDYAPAHYNLGDALLAEGQLDGAISQYREAVKIAPDSTAPHDDLAAALLQKSQLDEAAGESREALKIDPDDAGAYNNLGNALVREGHVDQAISDYEHAVAINPNMAEVHNNLGYCFLQTGKVDDAIQQYQRAVEIQTNFFRAYNNLADAFRVKGAAAQAIASYEKAVELDPQFLRPQVALAWMLATWPDPAVRNGDEAVAVAENANQLSGGDKYPQILRALAAAYAEDRRFPEAVATAKKALTLATAQSNTALTTELQTEIGFYQTNAPYRSTGD